MFRHTCEKPVNNTYPSRNLQRVRLSASLR
jgi:hypothetical protein